MGKMSELALEMDEMYDGTEGMSDKELKKQMNEGSKKGFICKYKDCKQAAKIMYNAKEYCVKHYREVTK